MNSDKLSLSKVINPASIEDLTNFKGEIFHRLHVLVGDDTPGFD
jgi:hypothetical protein